MPDVAGIARPSLADSEGKIDQGDRAGNPGLVDTIRAEAHMADPDTLVVESLEVHHTVQNAGSAEEDSHHRDS